MSRTKGSVNMVKLPSSYDTGCPAVNFWLAILGQARKDINWHYAKIMWADFKEAEYYGRKSPDILGTAWWVVEYVNERWCG